MNLGKFESDLKTNKHLLLIALFHSLSTRKSKVVDVAAAQGDWEKLLEDRVREVSRGWVILSLTGRGENWDLLSV